MTAKEHYELHHLSQQMGDCPYCQLGAEMSPIPVAAPQVNIQKVLDLENQIVKAAPLLLLGLSAMTLWRYKYIIAAGAALYYYNKKNKGEML